MAKGKSSPSAQGTPSSLTSLLGLPTPAIQPLALADPVILNQLQHGNYGNEPVGDRRRYNPTKRSESPYAAVRSAARLLINPVGTLANRALRDVPTFATPNLVTLCLRRKARKEVLHALKRVGARSGKGQRRRHLFSDVKC